MDLINICLELAIINKYVIIYFIKKIIYFILNFYWNINFNF